MTAKEQKFYPEDELVALVRSLDRQQDNGLFSRDVLIEYPHLAEKYTRVCPKRMDLTTAAQKAASGAYSYDAKLTVLQDDVDLMVNNCYRFNGVKGPLADIASNFYKFAKEQIDGYVKNKTGGRRVSSLRLASATDEMVRGKRQRDETRQGNNHKNDSNVGDSGGVNISDIVKLVDMLNRREDKEAFAVDVAEVYPDLREVYEEVCPVKMNLIIAKERAANGYYLGLQQQQQQKQKQTTSKLTQPSVGEASSLPSVFGSTVAESLVLLRDDVELMVSNCIKFNANVQEWVQLAQSFQVYAHKKIDDFVLRHAPALKGTTLGVEKYTGARRQQGQKKKTPQQSQSQSQQLRLSSSYGSQEGEQSVIGVTPPVTIPSPAAKKGIAKRTAVAADVVVANYVTPTVKPTALQPVFITPAALRNRLISDHLHRETLRARLIHTPGEESKEENDNITTDNNTANDSSNNNKVAIGSFLPRTFQSALSCRAVLSAFSNSVRHFYRSQRERHDFADPFEYPRQEEQLYLDCITLIEQQFERLFLHALLYDREKADVYDWTAAKAAQKILEGGDFALSRRDVNSSLSRGCCWLDEVHLCYLVRFLQHFPQLMGLACAATDHFNVTGTPKSKPTLRITQVAKGIIEKLTKITEELLTFIAEYETKVVNAEKKEELGQEL